MALVKHNNNSISAVTSMASLTTGAMTFIKEQTASSSASVSFVDGSGGVVLDSTYPIYKFEFINIHPSSDTTDLDFQVSTDGGSSYGVTATTTFFTAEHSESGSSANITYSAARDLAQSTGFQALCIDTGNQNDESCSGELFLFNPSSTTFVKHFLSRVNSYHGSNYSIEGYGAGYFNTTSSVDAIKFQFDAGNIDSGTIKLYGIKDS